MKMTIASTSKLVEVNGVECRVWEGETAAGVPVIALIPRVMAARNSCLSEFERELKETKAPSAAVSSIPARLIL